MPEPETQSPSDGSPLAGQSDLEAALLRELTPPETKYLEHWLWRAQDLFVAKVPNLLALAEKPDLARAIRGIIAEALARVFRNPEGLQQEDEGNYSYRVNLAVASGLLHISDTEVEQIAGRVFLSSIPLGSDGYARARYGNGALGSAAFQYGWPTS